ncbi:dihydroorotase [Myxococcota bacterium]
MNLIIQNGRILDPARNKDEVADLLIEDGCIRSVAAPGTIQLRDAEVFDARGRWVTPGLIDIHVHLRDPGQEYKEDIGSGARTAAAGGFTAMVAMPNTQPVIDNAEMVRYVAERGQQVGLCRVLPTGAVTAGQAGEGLAPFAEMKRAGAVAVTDDGHPVADPQVMRRALEYTQDFDLVVMSHAEEPRLSMSGHMHEGAISTGLGLRGIPGAAEDVAVGRDLSLAELTGGRLHIQHVSTARSVELVREAKARGLRVTAEATPHHFSLNHEAVVGYDTSTKVNPPLREESDRQAVVDGLKDGTLDAIATDHAPHSSVEKDVAFADAENGVIGLQTALPLALQLWRNGDLQLLQVIERLTSGPARVLGLPHGTVGEGAIADVTIINPEAEWTLSDETNLSKSRNSPFWRRALMGRVEATIVAGKMVYHSTRNPVWSGI